MAFEGKSQEATRVRTNIMPDLPASTSKASLSEVVSHRCNARSADDKRAMIHNVPLVYFIRTLTTIVLERNGDCSTIRSIKWHFTLGRKLHR